jgi:hypothetical protein
MEPVTFAVITVISIATNLIYGEIKDASSKKFYKEQSEIAEKKGADMYSASERKADESNAKYSKEMRYDSQRMMDPRSTSKRRGI